MEAFGEANGHSLGDSFSLYERYMKSFNVVDTFSCNNITYGEIANEPLKTDVPHNCDLDDCRDVAESANDEVREAYDPYNNSDLLTYEKKSSTNDSDFQSNECESLRENLSTTCDNSFTYKLDLPGSSGESEHSHHPKPVIITSVSTMENSNNAVDSIPMFRPVEPAQNVFKLPCELTFNGTLKHVQKLKPIVDPLTALSSSNIALSDQDYNQSKLFIEENESIDFQPKIIQDPNHLLTKSSNDSRTSDVCDKSDESSKLGTVTSTGDSKSDREKWSDSYSSVDTSYDSGLRSPDIFSDGYDEDDADSESEKFWDFIHEFEAYDKAKIKKIEETLQGVPPPPSVTVLKIDVNEMLKKYYTYLPNFGVDSHIDSPENNSRTPTKRQVYIRIPTIAELNEPKQEIASEPSICGEEDVQVSDIVMCTVNNDKQSEAIKLHTTEVKQVLTSFTNDHKTQDDVKTESCKYNLLQTSTLEGTVKEINVTNENGKSETCLNKSNDNMTIKMCTQAEARETAWPDVLKCRCYDLHYNITKFSERIEQLAVKCSERFVGCDTDCSVSVFSGGARTPSSATKRKAMRLKMAQAKSPGRRLSHLARRRQAFYSAANVGEKSLNSTSRMVLIDKKKLVNTSDRKSPRNRRTPGKKTPAKTPKTRSGGSSKKKAMRRLLLDQGLTRSQPTRESSRRALFISPEQRKSIPVASTSSVPVRAFKSKRALFSSPDAADTKSEDGTRSDTFLKRKCSFDSESRNKMAKSLSFGGDCINSQPSCSTSVSRRASEMFSTKSMMAELDAQHRKKLLWAVSEALRVHGWRMQSPGFREKASALAQLTRRILTLPHHANRLNSPHLSTSDTLFKLARLHVFSIIQGKSIEECFQEEKVRLAEQAHRMAVYASNSMYQQTQKPSTSTMSQVKENLSAIKQEQPKSTSKNVLQDKVVNIDSNSNSSCGVSMLDKTALFKSNSMPSFEEAAKMKARRQISFDNIEFPKR